MWFIKLHTHTHTYIVIHMVTTHCWKLLPQHMKLNSHSQSQSQRPPRYFGWTIVIFLFSNVFLHILLSFFLFFFFLHHFSADKIEIVLQSCDPECFVQYFVLRYGPCSPMLKWYTFSIIKYIFFDFCIRILLWIALLFYLLLSSSANHE